MYSKCGQFLPIESGPRIILPYVVFRVHLSSDSMAWCVSIPHPPPKLRVSFHQSTHHTGRSGNTIASSEQFADPDMPASARLFLFPSSRSDGKSSHPSHAKFQISQSTTLSHPPLFVSIHAMPAIPLLGFCFLRGKNFIDSSLSVCADAGLAKIGIRHSGKTIKGLRQRETGKEKAGEREKEFAIKKSR